MSAPPLAGGACRCLTRAPFLLTAWRRALATATDKPVKTVSKSDVVDLVLAKEPTLSKKQVAAVVQGVLDTIVETVAAGDKVTIIGCAPGRIAGAAEE